MHPNKALLAATALAMALSSSAILADSKPARWGDEMRAHMKTFEKDKGAMAAAKKTCDGLKPSVRLDDAKCVAVERREAIDVARPKRPVGVF